MQVAFNSLPPPSKLYIVNLITGVLIIFIYPPSITLLIKFDARWFQS